VAPPEADDKRRQRGTVASRVKQYLAVQDAAGRAWLEAQARARIEGQPVPSGSSPRAWLESTINDVIAETLGLSEAQS
jgi:hypothetical protein